jgi:signal transduction histidine kinase
MSVLDIPEGEIVIRQGDPADEMVVILEGGLRSERSDGSLYTAQAKQVTGLLPYSRLTHYPGTTRTSARTRIARLHKQYFEELHHRFPQITGRLVHVLSDRVRESTATDQQREKMMALGKLSAGLAHELNNPASAAGRSANTLKKALTQVRAAALKLDRGGLPQDSRVFLAELELNWAKRAGPREALDSLDRSDREETISAWLRAHQVEAVWDLAESLVDLGCTKETLEEVAQKVPAEFLNDVLLRMAAAFTISRLADDIESSTGRISELVQAIKEYSYMDQAAEQEVDIHQGIENTLIMLRPKLKNGVDVERVYDRTLPRVCARGSELNQIWTNLIVNAADAMNGKGKLTVRTSRDNGYVKVEVQDTGPGIPPEIRNRIFEPFFTTKPVGEGTGLGLDTVMKIARNHRGNVRVESKPGDTRFIVRIPLPGTLNS